MGLLDIAGVLMGCIVVVGMFLVVRSEFTK
jgi:hypothetical protein